MFTIEKSRSVPTKKEVDLRLVQQTLPTRRVVKCLRIEDSVLWVARSASRRPFKMVFVNLPTVWSAVQVGLLLSTYFIEIHLNEQQVLIMSVFRHFFGMLPSCIKKSHELEDTYSKKRAEIRQQKTPQLDLKPETYDLLSYSALSTFLGG